MHQRKRWSWLLIILLISAACSSQTQQSNTTPKPDDDAMIARFIASAPTKLQSKATATPFAQSSQVNPPGLPLPNVEPLYVIGDLLIAGAASIGPVTHAVYKQFIEEGYSGVIKIQELGTADGFRIYCEAGESDIAMALRPMVQTELDSCIKHGRMPVALQIGFNPIAIVTNKANTFSNDVTMQQLNQMFVVARWSDITPEWPAQNIVRYVPKPTFGIFNYFVDLVLNSDAQMLQKASFATLVDDQATLLESVAANDNAVGFVDYPFYAANASELKLLSVEGAKPTLTTTLTGAYPLITPILLYTDPNTLQAKPQVAEFLTFYLAHLDKALAEAHEFPMNVERLDRTKIILAQAIGNSNYLNQISQLRKQTPTSTPASPATPTALLPLPATGTLTNSSPITNTPAR